MLIINILELICFMIYYILRTQYFQNNFLKDDRVKAEYILLCTIFHNLTVTHRESNIEVCQLYNKSELTKRRTQNKAIL